MTASRLLAAVLMVLALAGCQATPKGTVAENADAPQLIKELTNQTTIYTCPTCKMEFDRAGQCYMCDVALVETRVDYACPADNQPVQQAGKCPRCDMQAMAVRTAAHTPAADGGANETPADAGATPGTTGGH